MLDMNPHSLTNFENLAVTNALEVRVTQPFTRADGPTDIEVPETFTEISYSLTDADPFPDRAIVAHDGVYVIALSARIRSELPPLETIRERVTQDYRRSRGRELAREAGQKFHAQASSGMEQGKSFQEIAAEAKVNLLDLPPFSKRTQTLPELPNRNDFGDVKKTAMNLGATNNLSGFVVTGDGGFVLQVQARVPVDDAKVKADLPQFLNNLRQSRQFEAFNEWLRKEVAVARISIPGMKNEELD